MIKIGITGGIGSGKSVVATLMGIMNIPVYIADDESKKLTDTSSRIREPLIALFGTSLYTPQGLDRRKLASLIFGDPAALARVNAIIHPEVNRHFLDWSDRQSGFVCAIESAILFEAGFDSIVNISLMVYAPLELCIERALRRGGLSSREEVIRRMNNQLPDEIKKERADYVIMNDDSHAIIPQVEAFLTSLLP